jgi:hypothetical protein
MKLVVNFEDKMLVLDGVGFHAGDRLSSPDANFRVIQWTGQGGWIEVYQGERIWLTEATDMSQYVQLFNQMAAEAQAVADAIAAADAAAVAAELAASQSNSGE